MLVNPYGVFAAYLPFDDKTGTFYSLEICDPVSSDVNEYQINGISASDFVLPEWFYPFVAEPRREEYKQVDYSKRLTKPAPPIVPGLSLERFSNLQSSCCSRYEPLSCASVLVALRNVRI
jgi:hypothetical protein